MAETDQDIDADRWYSAREAAPLLEIQEATLKNKLRSSQIAGLQRGSKKVWFVKGSTIIKVRKDWNLEFI